MNNLVIILIFIILIIGLYLLNKPNPTLSSNKKIINNIKCSSDNAYIVDNINTDNIERNTIKSVLKQNIIPKLFKIDLLIPSMMYGTFCNTVYSTYYNFIDYNFPKEIFENLDKSKIKRVRVRHYLFDPNIYFEIKWKNNKIRTLIDNEYNILEPENINPLYEKIIYSFIKAIKNNKMQKLFYNEYKRFSFIYKLDPSIRITIDTNIQIKYNNLTQIMPFDILEIKYPINMSYEQIMQYIQLINEEANINIKIIDFSKADYANETMIIPDKYKIILNKLLD